MSDKVFLTAPQKTDKMPPGIPFIVGNEAAERFNFYGMRAVLVIFMTQYLRDRSGALAPMSDNEANGWYHLFLASNYFFPAIGAIIADAFWGKYNTILRISLIYCVGCIALAVDDTRMGLAVGLGLIAIGAGGIKPCVSSHVGDQFGSSNKHLLARAFGWFYFAVNFGSFFSIILTPLLLKNYGPEWAFGVPAGLMLMATFVFWSGRYKFIHIPAQGRGFFAKTFNRESGKALGRLAILFVFVAVFWSLWDQSGGEWVLQAERMDRVVFGVELLSSQIQAVNAILVLAFIPLFQYVIYPLVGRFWKLTELRKIGAGIFLIGISFLVSAWIERELNAGVQLNVMWQMPAYALLTAAEVLTSITALEFAYTQAPKHLKAIVQALYLLSVSAGNLFTGLVHFVIANPDGTSKLHGASYYHFYAVLSMVAAIIFAFVALRYRPVNYLQDEDNTQN